MARSAALQLAGLLIVTTIAQVAGVPGKICKTPKVGGAGWLTP